MSPIFKTSQQRQPISTATEKVYVALATLGVGFLPKASGTFGSLIALLLWIPLSSQTLMVRGFALIFVIVLGTYVAQRCIRFWGEDPSQVIIDEVAGMWLTLFYIHGKPIGIWIIAFVLFRSFDILKPSPIRQLEKLHGGIGIMIDDLIAGLYALFTLTFIELILRGAELL